MTRYAAHVAAALGLVALVAVLVWRYDRAQQAREATWDPRAIVWTVSPLRVWWDDADLKGYGGAIGAAMGIINGRAGCQVLVRTHDRSEAHIVLHSYDGTSCGVAIDDDPKAAAMTSWCADLADVQFRRLDEMGLAVRVIGHELGHGVGLAHDPTGLMAPVAADPQPGDPPEFLLMSNADAAAVRARFCQ